jgi:aminoglycoside phosphotransferase (APT) family kinase protein
MPRLLGWDDDGVHPLLAIEDLSAATWPPPWTALEIAQVLETLAELHECSPPGHARDMGTWRTELTSWPMIADDPGPFLSLGLCSIEWLELVLPDMIDAERAAPLDGDAALHMDVRSDNLCLRDGQAVLVDWNWITAGNPAFDVAGWLPSLELERGPRPEEVMPACPPGFPALLSGYFCAHAGLPPIPTAPHVRRLQMAQARTSLPWAARALGLPPPT